MQFTTQQISDLFFGIPTWKSYAQLSEELSTVDLEVSEVMIQELFRAAGFNLRNRPRKSTEKASWFTIVQDTNQINQTQTVEVV